MELETNPRADLYFAGGKPWQQETKLLRNIVLSCGLQEKVKWGCPCYTYNDTNVVLIHVFKEYCALLFFKGALLKDPKKMLIQQTQNVQAARQARFTNAKEISALEKLLKSYIYEAIEVEKAGLKVTLKKTTAFPVPEEFEKALSKNRQLKSAFNALTPGRQRAYLLFFGAAKQSQTREARIEKSISAILKGKGLND